MRWKHTVNDIIANHWSTTTSLGLNTHQLRHLNNISKCHTAALGGVVLTCKDCGLVQYKYHSCRNRHCPSCQGSKREEWIERQQQYLLDVPYFHVVLTLPCELRSLCLHMPRVMYNLLFKASWETIATLSKDIKYLGAQSGMTAILHTWSQNLSLHPHLHCIIPGGGVTKSGKWKTTRSKGKYLFPAKVLRVIFKAIFLNELKALMKVGVIKRDRGLLDLLYGKKWVVYAKRPFAKPAHVIEYLGRYTHKVGISNYRIICVNSTHVTFHYKDYRHAGTKKEMTLTIGEFIRRFALHILPHRFVRIRHYGLLSYHGRSKKIPDIQDSQGYQPKLDLIVCRPNVIVDQCLSCGSKKLSSQILPKQNIRSP